MLLLPQRYVFSSKSQPVMKQLGDIAVVVATTKVHIFKQITTTQNHYANGQQLLLLPQRYVFSSKSQLNEVINNKRMELLLLPQRYVFSSKSQQKSILMKMMLRCCCYHKGTYFQANHNMKRRMVR